MVEPYALKEYRNRWYIIANDLKDSRIKSFALDRLLNLEITRTVFEVPINFNLEERYSNCFGIINPDEGDEVQKIILSLNPLQGKYVKTLPLHESQLVLVDNENEFRVQLHMFITHDFIMELLSMGENVEVIKPKYLRTIIANSLRSTLSYYD